MKVFDHDEIRLTFSGNQPTDADVRRLQLPLLCTTVTHSTADALRGLAAAYRRVSVPKDKRGWYFARKEVAEDIDRFAARLQDFVEAD